MRKVARLYAYRRDVAKRPAFCLCLYSYSRVRNRRPIVVSGIGFRGNRICAPWKGPYLGYAAPVYPLKLRCPRRLTFRNRQRGEERPHAIGPHGWENLTLAGCTVERHARLGARGPPPHLPLLRALPPGEQGRVLRRKQALIGHAPARPGPRFARFMRRPLLWRLGAGSLSNYRGRRAPLLITAGRRMAYVFYLRNRGLSR